MITQNKKMDKRSFMSRRNDELINALKQFENTQEISAEIIRSYLYYRIQNVSNIQNKIILDLLEKSNVMIFNEIQKYKSEWTFKDLEYILYSFFDDKTISKNGIIFTPTEVSDYITEELFQNISDYNITICDLSCGFGEFLISSLKQIKNKFPEVSTIYLIEHCLFGIDILEENLYYSKVLLSICALEYGEDKESINFNLIQGDSIKLKNNFNLFPFKKNKFDFIVGNPPYVKIQDLESHNKKFLRENYYSCKKGNINLFYAFIELSFDYLNEYGKVGYVVPNHLLKMKSAKLLRNFLINNKLINKIIDFKDTPIFENAQTYSAIIFLDKKPKVDILYQIINDKGTNAELFQLIKTREFQSISYENINSDSINLLSENDLINIKLMESQKNKLNISTGIATQKDILYLLDLSREINKDSSDDYYYKEFDGQIYKIEKNITIDIIKGSGEKKISEGVSFYELNKIIFPYKEEGGKVVVIPEEEMRKDFPETYKYFLQIKSELGKRNGGKPNVKIWYEYGRAQSLNKTGPKIIYSTNSSKPNFIFFPNYALFNNGYAVFGIKGGNTEISLELLTKILNSKIVDYYIKKTSYMISGGYYCYQKKYLENFTVPDFTKDELEYLKKDLSQKEINKFLIAKYHLHL